MHFQKLTNWCFMSVREQKMIAVRWWGVRGFSDNNSLNWEDV